MKFSLLKPLFVVCWVLFAVAPARAFEIQQVISNEGIEAWLVEEHSIPIIAVEVIFRGGSAADPAKKEGLASMVSSLLDEGAGEYESLAFQKRLDDRAIRLSFSAGRDRFGASLTTLMEHRDEAFRLLGLALGEPRFDKDAVERIRQQMLASLAAREENSGYIAARTWYERVFDGHPYGRQGDGTPASVSAIKRADLRRFVSQRFARDNIIIGVVGDIDAETLAALIDATFAALPDESGSAGIAEITPVTAGETVIVRRAVPQTQALFGHAGIKRNDPDWYAALVMNYVLGGGGFSSRLMEEVREKRGLAYSVSSGLRPMEHSGVFIGSVGTQNARFVDSFGLIEGEIRRMHEDGVTAEELQDAKTYLTGSYPLNFSASGSIATQLVLIQLNQLGINYVNRRNSYIEAVTQEQIKRVAARLLQPDNLFWVVVGDPEGIENPAE